MRTHTLHKILLQTAFLFVTVSSLTTAVASQTGIHPGALDTTFGDGGIALAYSPGYQLYSAYAMAIQPDGKIVVVGEGVGSSHGGNWESAVVRFNPDGSHDTSLGGTGIVINPVGHGFYSLAIQPDGKIVVVSCVAAGTFGVVRYNPNGSLDTSFNGSGIVLTPVSEYGGPSSVAIQTDGKIVVAGSKGTDSFAIVRYNPNGSLDTSFNGSGIVLTLVGDSGGRGPSSVAIQTDDKIVVAGNNNGNDSFAIVRYNPNGSLDTSFTGTGIVTTSVGNYGVASDLAIQTDGKIVVVGNEFLSNYFAVVRYNPDGSLDTSFGGTGKIVIPVSDGKGDNYARSVTIQPNGKIVVAGITFIDGDSAFAVGRLNPNGSADTSFNGTGIVITSIGKRYGYSSYDEGGLVAIQADGKIVVAGDTGPDEFKDFVVVRYQGDAPNPLCSSANPIDCPDFFVRQHYQDFLNRQPDAEGFAFWTNEIASCVSDAQCIEVKRINVSAAFFLSIEFQQTGYLVYRIYKAAYGNLPNAPVPIKLGEFLPDTRQIGQGVVVLQPGWETVLENNKQVYLSEFVERERFTSAFPLTMTAEAFVDNLNANAGNPLTETERDHLVSDLSTGVKTRAQVLRAVAENPQFAQQEFNRAFVLMQYFGYLRRDPDSAPDSNYTGYQFWLAKLDQFGGDFTQAEMVKAFIQSTEYRQRFAQ